MFKKAATSMMRAPPRLLSFVPLILLNLSASTLVEGFAFITPQAGEDAYCTTENLAFLNSWWRESVALGVALQEALADIQHDIVAALHFSVFLGVKFTLINGQWVPADNVNLERWEGVKGACFQSLPVKYLS
jgi:hypothetical protein